MSDAPLPADVREQLAAAEQRGAARFDPAASELIATLLDRAESLGGIGGERLVRSAGQHLVRLDERHRRACERGRARVAEVVARGGAVSEHAREALEDGDPAIALREVRRAEAIPVAPRPASRASRRRYRSALADLQTAFARTRAPTAPEHAGLLNGADLALRVLERAESLSPTWRRSLVAGLTDLAALMHLPEAPTPRRRPARG